MSSEYFIKIVFSVCVQSFVCKVKRTGDKTHPCGMPVYVYVQVVIRFFTSTEEICVYIYVYAHICMHIYIYIYICVHI